MLHPIKRPPPPSFKIIHQTNGGVDVARNTGIAASTGEYICFADSDDWLPRDSVRILYDRIRETGADAVFANHKRVHFRGVGNRGDYKRAVIDISDKEALSDLLGMGFPPWGALYRGDIIRDNQLWFPPGMSFDDDTYFVFRYLGRCKKIATTPESAYYFNGIVDESVTRGKTIKWLPYVCRSLEERVKLFDEDNVPLEEQRKRVQIFQRSLSNVCDFARDEGLCVIEEGYREARKFLDNISDEIFRVFPGDEDIRLYGEIKPLLRAGDYDKIYDLYQQRREEAPKDSKFRVVMRKIVIKPEQFVIFKLRWFYKK